MHCIHSLSASIAVCLVIDWLPDAIIAGSRRALQNCDWRLWFRCHMNDCMAPYAASASWNSNLNCRRMYANCGQSKTYCRSSPIACVLHNVHRRNCRGTIGLASLPCSTGKEWEAIRNCINNRNLEIDMGMSRYCSKRNWLGRKNNAK